MTTPTPETGLSGATGLTDAGRVELSKRLNGSGGDSGDVSVPRLALAQLLDAERALGGVVVNLAAANLRAQSEIRQLREQKDALVAQPTAEQSARAAWPRWRHKRLTGEDAWR